MDNLKETFLRRYIDTIDAYLNYKGSGEGHRAIMYVMEEYKKIMVETFGMEEDAVENIYMDKYKEKYR